MSHRAKPLPRKLETEESRKSQQDQPTWSRSAAAVNWCGHGDGGVDAGATGGLTGEIPGATVPGGPHTVMGCTSRDSPRFSDDDPRKILLCFWQREGERNESSCNDTQSAGRYKGLLCRGKPCPTWGKAIPIQPSLAFRSHLRNTAEVRVYLQKGRASEKG